jgi:hypothetical protein
LRHLHCHASSLRTRPVSAFEHAWTQNRPGYHHEIIEQHFTGKNSSNRLRVVEHTPQTVAGQDEEGIALQQRVKTSK